MKGRGRNKNISSFKRKIYVLLLGTAGIVTAYYLFVNLKQGTELLLEKFFDVRHINVEFKAIYTASIKNELQAIVEKTFANENLFLFNFEHFADELKQKFPIISNVAWQQRSSDKAILQIEGYKPAYLVNDSMVLLPHGILVSKELFAEYDIPLKAIAIEQPMEYSHDRLCEVIAFADSLGDFVWQDYSLTYHSPAEILLAPKQQDKILQEIVTNQKMAFSPNNKQQIMNVIEDMHKKNTYPSKKIAKLFLIFDYKIGF